MTRPGAALTAAALLVIAGGAITIPLRARFATAGAVEPVAHPAVAPEHGVPAGPAANNAQPVRLDVLHVKGAAHRVRGNSSTPLAVGDRIERSDLVSTAAGGSVELANRDGGSLIQVSSSSRVRIDRIDARETGLTLERGRVRAAAPEGGRVRMKAEGTDTAAETVGGDFTMQTEPNGTVRVFSHRNKVTLFARDEHVEVGPGAGGVVANNLGPRRIVVPAKLLLKVRWPAQNAQRERQIAVTGSTTPGALVRSAGSEVVADDHGQFVIHIPLHEGRNIPQLTTEDLSGRLASTKGRALMVDSKRPLIEHQGVRYDR